MKQLKYLFIIILVLILGGCAASQKNPYAQKRKKSYINTTQLGRNKYFFSKEYQKKLQKTYRKKLY